MEVCSHTKQCGKFNKVDLTKYDYLKLKVISNNKKVTDSPAPNTFTKKLSETQQIYIEEQKDKVVLTAPNILVKNKKKVQLLSLHINIGYIFYNSYLNQYVKVSRTIRYNIEY